MTLRHFFLSGLLSLLCAVSQAQTVSVKFQVDMSYQAEQGKFNPAVDRVDIAGTFNGWGSGTPAWLSDGDGDGVYEVIVDGFTSYQAIEYKYRLNGTWTGGREEFPGAGNNRQYVVQANSNVVRVWYNDEVPASGPPSAAFSASTPSVTEGGLVFFEDRSLGAVETWEWSFEGGTPAASSEQYPSVRYAEAGRFDVTLVAGGAEGRDTLFLRDYIQGQDRSTAETFWWNDAVFYELFVRSFYDSDGDGVGDFNGIAEKLDYLNDGDASTTTDLGITGIWLMPINPSPSYHGYDVTDYRAVNPAYGTMADFRRFLDEAHRRGIRVIIDFVMNHSSNQHPWFRKSAQQDAFYRDFYRWSASDPDQTGPWGQQVWHARPSGYNYGLFWSGMPDLNYETEAVQDSIFAASSFWLEEVGVDGFRLDAVKYIFEEGAALENTESTFRFWSDFTSSVDAAKPDAFAVCEAWDATSTSARYVTDGRLDACFEFDLAAAILGAVQNGDARRLAVQMENVYATYPHLQYGTFLTNHDQNRVMDVLAMDEEQARLAAALYLTLPGIPFLYYGEEIGQTGVKPDEMIRRPMQWSSAPNAGFTTGNPWIAPAGDYAVRNVDNQEGDPASLLNWYKRLIGLRNREAALRLGEYHGAVSSAPTVFAFVRRNGSEAVLVAANTGGSSVSELTLSAPSDLVRPGTYRIENLLAVGDSSSVSVSEEGELTGFSLAPYEAKVFKLSTGVASGSSGEPARPGKGAELQQSHPNPAGGRAIIRFQIPDPGHVSLEVFNVAGQRVSRPVDGMLTAGAHTAEVDTKSLPDGIYYYRLETGGRHLTRQMVVIK